MLKRHLGQRRTMRHWLGRIWSLPLVRMPQAWQLERLGKARVLGVEEGLGGRDGFFRGEREKREADAEASKLERTTAPFTLSFIVKT